MKLICRKATTNGVRHQIILPKYQLSKNNRLSKSLMIGSKMFAGRSSQTGRITVRHQGGGCKRLYRQINFSNAAFFGVVLAICYDPNRSAFLNYNYNFITQKPFFTLSVNGLHPGSLITCNTSVVDYKLGYRLPIINLPIGTLISSISQSADNNSQLTRSAGTYAQILQITKKSCKIRLPSGQIKNLPNSTYATIGTVSNTLKNKTVIGKAGRQRLKGIRPTVRGIAMNPVDHPHGGRTNGGRPSVTPWGIPTKGKPTRKKTHE